MVGECIKVYKTVAGANNNREKSVGLQLGTWKVKSIPSDSTVRRWTKCPVKFLEVWFGPNLQVEQKWVEVLNKVNQIVKNFSWQQLSLKGTVYVANMFLTSINGYRLTFVACSDSWSMKLERQHFYFM